MNKIFITCGVEPITVVIEENQNDDYLIKHPIKKMSTSLSVSLIRIATATVAMVLVMGVSVALFSGNEF